MAYTHIYSCAYSSAVFSSLANTFEREYKLSKFVLSHYKRDISDTATPTHRDIRADLPKRYLYCGSSPYSGNILVKIFKFLHIYPKYPMHLRYKTPARLFLSVIPFTFSEKNWVRCRSRFYCSQLRYSQQYGNAQIYVCVKNTLKPLDKFPR